MPAAVTRGKRRFRVRKRTVLATLALITLAIGIGSYLLIGSLASRQLREAIADADRLDPGWRLAEIGAKRSTVPHGETSADQVATLLRLLPLNWPPTPPKSRNLATPDSLEFEEDLLTRIG